MKKRVLAVDDDAGALEAIRQILLQKGYDVATAPDGERALDLLQGPPFDLVLLDVVMPGLSGFDVCRRIRSDARTRDVPVVLLTGKDRMQDIAEGQQAGSDLYLVKPVLATKLLNTVGMLLRDAAPVRGPV
jgi:two-component system cell cycle response regulator